MKRKNKTLVIIPAYNEEATIKEVITRSLPFADVCVVNDGSKDKTKKIVESIPKVACINHIKNTHIPQAILDGMNYAINKNYDYIITMDSGLSHSPEELINFTNAPHSDLVIGIRKNKKNTPLYRRAGSWAAKVLINLAIRPMFSKLPPAQFKDVTSGFRRYSKKAVKLLLSRKLRAKSFDFHTEALMIVYRNNLLLSEVPISYNYSSSSLNSKVIKQGFNMFLNMLLSNRK